MRKIIIISLAIITMTAFSFPGHAAESTPEDGPRASLKIVRITPSGEDVPPGRQVVIQFNRPVVPIGRMDRESSEIPVTIEPALKCSWRWLNTSALACQLGENDALSAATSYQMTIEPGIKTEDGATTGR